ncbi:hypothetical protein, partial [Faecalibacterium sp. An121]|uniref:hypothetical protein n=1 Tax=Faecalibacterium sp. An121 TaxID=1965550 RepID=UPI0019D041CA
QNRFKGRSFPLCAYHNIPPPVSRPNFKFSLFFFIFFSLKSLTLGQEEFGANEKRTLSRALFGWFRSGIPVSLS